ncbi:MAG: helix-turn-helix transcriptional regulator [Flavobacteriales bacterium]|jgi:transcriptional regulator with XRE-family HTH domain|nr:helix-turn-helix transcriptional regulator [Flavobacteriales bacterium]
MNRKKYLIEFGKHLIILRTSKGLSKENLANEAKIPINQVGRIERGEISTSTTTLFAIPKVKNISIKELFDFS